MSTDKELEVLYPDGKEMIIGGEKFMIKPFVLNNRTKIIRLFASIFSDLNKNQQDKSSNNVDMGLKFIEVAGDRIIEVYQLILNKDAEWLGSNLTIKQEVELVKTVMEINDFPFLVRQVKGMMLAMK